MAKIISIHAFERGTGKSNITANIAVVLAATGYRVGVIDSDAATPVLHTLFGLESQMLQHSLNDFLWGKCEIAATAVDLKQTLSIPLAGAIYFVPFVVKPNTIDYDISLLSDSFQLLINELKLDLLLIDGQPGLDRAVLPTLAFADMQVVVLRPDERDYQGTGVTLDVSQSLGIPDVSLIVNQMPPPFNAEQVKQQVEQVYHCEVIAVLPQATEMSSLDNTGLFVLRYPGHPLSLELTKVAAILSV